MAQPAWPWQQVGLWKETNTFFFIFSVGSRRPASLFVCPSQTEVLWGGRVCGVSFIERGSALSGVLPPHRRSTAARGACTARAVQV